MALLPSSHFLALPRPDVLVGPPAGVVDTTTLAAHDFDVDTRTGFMPPDPPLTRLPSRWEPWEQLLDDAQSYRLQLGSKIGITDEEKARSESWRARVAQLPTLPTVDLYQSELLLRRSHHVLAWTMHFYIHSLPQGAEIRIPAPITVPLLQVCVQLQLPPVITYSDDVLYNWALKAPSAESTPALDNLRCITLFTGLRDEEEFYLASARIELRGVDALEIMRATMDELFIGDVLAARRITRYLHSLVRVLDDLARLLLAVRDGCDPDTFYHVIRPWFNGADSGTRKWTFEGLEDHPGLRVPTEISGPSAAQSSLVHALDTFLGVDHHTTTGQVGTCATGATAVTARDPRPKVPFLTRMRTYMPRHHRNFLRHLGAAPRPLRAAVARMGDAALTEAYNAAVDSLRRFRDAHLRIVALYIINPSHRGEGEGEAATGVPGLLRGTGGTDLVRFLKGVRDRTSEAAFPVERGAP
ncbi:Indoleamine 2,3-dioxygenase [Russula ochroleuca]|uniref:Indoleamine 2,3-dioxygenase n=1 Tax=Russula ochroleuca TaxID=152965 RepID=A0A9P5MPN7_9AGAM|nr:Indoleamine 2,3-dioxygenase [Russula ochroleuca]KAF8486430.1 Indoleamine 2,3-dioxygenase [Russula ochroleuca]